MTQLISIVAERMSVLAFAVLLGGSTLETRSHAEDFAAPAWTQDPAAPAEAQDPAAPVAAQNPAVPLAAQDSAVPLAARDPTAAQAQDPGGVPERELFEIGSRGARIDAAAGWRRHRFDPALGNDQFVFSEGLLSRSVSARAVVFEIDAILEDRADMEQDLETRMMSLAGTVVRTGEIEFLEQGDVSRIARETEIVNNGALQRYRIEVLSKAGLTYVVAGWGAPKEKELSATLSAFAGKLSFPSEDSDWARSTRPVTKRVAAGGGYEISFSYRPSVFEEPSGSSEPSGSDALIRLVSRDDMRSILVYRGAAADSADLALDDVVRQFLSGSEDASEVDRADVTVGERKARRSRIVDGAVVIDAVAVPQGEGRWFDVRFAWNGTPSSRRHDRDLLFETLQVRKIEGGGAYPDPPESPEPPPLAACFAAVLEASTAVGDTGVYEVDATCATGARLLVAGDGQIRSLDSGGASRTLLLDAQERTFGSVAMRGDEVFAAAARSGELMAIAGGRCRGTGIDADEVAALGSSGDLAVVRSTYATSAPGIDTSSADPTRIDAIGAAGAERAIIELEPPVLDLVADISGRRLLLVTGRAYPPYDPPPRLVMVDGIASEPAASRRDAGASRDDAGASRDDAGASRDDAGASRRDLRDLGQWAFVDALGPADDGFVVTGRPVGAPTGVYRLVPGEEPVLLLGGEEFRGVALERGVLSYLCALRIPHSMEQSDTMVLYRAPLDRIATAGPSCQPFGVRSINEIAAHVLSEGGWPFDSGDSVRGCARKARAVASERTGFALPSEGELLDRLFMDLCSDVMPIFAGAEQVLAALLADALLAEGATWVPARRPAAAIAGQPRFTSITDNLVAVAYSPLDVIASTLHDAEGAWNPVQSMRAYAQGREMLLGVDRDTLVQALDSRPDPDLARLCRAGDVDGLRRVLSQKPTVEFLRIETYALLAGLESYEALRDLAAPFASTESALESDVRAWLLGRIETLAREDDAISLAREDDAISLAREDDAISLVRGDDAISLVRDAKSAVARFPSSPAMYYYLGLAHEWAGATDHARACFHRALDLDESDDIASWARDRLEATTDTPGDGGER